MARLQLTINGVTGVRQMPDGKAAAIAALIFDNAVAPTWPTLLGGPPLPSTPQEKLQAVVDHIAIEMRDMARGYRRRQLDIENNTAKEIALAEIDVT